MRISDLIAIVRIADLDAFNEKLVGLFRQLNPNSAVTQPARGLLGSYLRNPRLEAVRQNAFFELLVFATPSADESPYVAAFPILDRETYSRVLIKQPRIREQQSDGDISVYREDAAAGTRHFYVSALSGDVVLYSENRHVLEKARQIYQRAPPRGLLQHRAADVSLRLYARQYLNVRNDALRSFFGMAYQDILHDTLGRASDPEHALAKGLLDLFGSQRHAGLLENLLKQFRLVDLGILFDSRAIVAQLDAELTADQSIRHALSNNPANLPGLAAYLPRECDTYRNLLLWPQQTRPLLEGLSGIVREAFDSTIDEDARKFAFELMRKLMAAGPQEVASGSLLPPSKARELGLLQVKLVRWKAPEKLPELALHFRESLDQSGILRQMLTESGINQIRFESSPARIEYLPGSVATVHTAVLLCRAKGGQTAAPSFFGKPQRYLLALHEDILVTVTSGIPADSPLDARVQREESIVLQQVLRSLAGKSELSLRTRPYFRISVRDPLEGELFRTAANPLRLLYLAMVDMAATPPPSLHERPPLWRDYAEELRTFVEDPGVRDERALAQPLTLRAGASEERLTVAMILPRDALADLARASLAISAERPMALEEGLIPGE